jgi:glutathione S-transferase
MFAAEHGLDLEIVPIDVLHNGTHDPNYAAVNPNCIIPFLVDDDFSLGESAAILKYLAEKLDTPDYPRDLRGRTKVNEALDWFNSNVSRDFAHGVVYPRVLPPHHLPEAASLPGIIRHGERACQRWLGVLDRAMLADSRPFVCGNGITLADYLGASLISLGWLIDFDFSPYPRITAWLERLTVRPAWAAANTGFNGWLSGLRKQRAEIASVGR